MIPTVGDLKRCAETNDRLHKVIRELIAAPWSGNQFLISASISNACAEEKHEVRRPNGGPCICGRVGK